MRAETFLHGCDEIDDAIRRCSLTSRPERALRAIHRAFRAYGEPRSTALNLARYPGRGIRARSAEGKILATILRKSS
jgi:hypothetical protein